MRARTRQEQRLLSANDAAVLGLLGWGETSGYDLERLIRRTVGFFWTSAKSHVYGTLARLVDAGYASVRDVEQTGRPDKQLYRITRTGERAMKQWLDESPLEPARFRNAFLLKIFFAERMDREALIRHIEEGRAEVAAELAQLEAIAAPGAKGELGGRLALEYGLARDRATIAWADRALRELRRGK